MRDVDKLVENGVLHARAAALKNNELQISRSPKRLCNAAPRTSRLAQHSAYYCVVPPTSHAQSISAVSLQTCRSNLLRHVFETLSCAVHGLILTRSIRLEKLLYR